MIRLLSAKVVPPLAVLGLVLGRRDRLTQGRGRVRPTGWSVGITRDPFAPGSVLGIQE